MYHLHHIYWFYPNNLLQTQKFHFLLMFEVFCLCGNHAAYIFGTSVDIPVRRPVILVAVHAVVDISHLLLGFSTMAYGYVVD